MRPLAVIRKHALKAWRDCNGDETLLKASLQHIAHEARAELVGFPIAIILTIFQVIQIVCWLWDRWHKNPPQEHDENELELIEARQFWKWN